jgi:hypothetical protein
MDTIHWAQLLSDPELAERYRQAHADALMAQDACNLSDVVRDCSKHMSTLWDVANALGYGYGTHWVNTHPVNILFSSKIARLSKSEAPLNFERAYDACVAVNMTAPVNGGK